MKALSIGLLLLAIALSLGMFWLSRLQLYVPNLLTEVQVKKLSENAWEIQFELPLESAYHPQLVVSHPEADRVVVEVYKQISIGPIQGLWRTLISTPQLFESLPSRVPNSRLYRAYLEAFGQDAPRFVLHGNGEYVEIPVAKDGAPSALEYGSSFGEGRGSPGQTFGFQDFILVYLGQRDLTPEEEKLKHEAIDAGMDGGAAMLSPFQRFRVESITGAPIQEFELSVLPYASVSFTIAGNRFKIRNENQGRWKVDRN